jgi:hypothetical protein
VGLADRVCVDLCCLCRPGEGLLVGSFARALFLVHSEVSHRRGGGGGGAAGRGAGCGQMTSSGVRCDGVTV